ncbi:hypothetical protein TcasGA2_TC009686 [Tribolium castaneum]|uniref:Uncharacterized protein n=1 Tax=Tribolium castaneum TaxID=7070 RepID=D6WU31_TRICA|nr:hypothetical protein TcasGA2_TC009686 [Tribolium castaneum]
MSQKLGFIPTDRRKITALLLAFYSLKFLLGRIGRRIIALATKSVY